MECKNLVVERRKIVNEIKSLQDNGLDTPLDLVQELTKINDRLIELNYYFYY